MVDLWTDQTVKWLRLMWRAGLTCSAIARELGEDVTPDAVSSKARRLGLERRPSPIRRAASSKKSRSRASYPPHPPKGVSGTNSGAR